jgi:hypothetical protein
MFKLVLQIPSHLTPLSYGLFIDASIKLSHKDTNLHLGTHGFRTQLVVPKIEGSHL